ncbi:TlyA family RNA methyltransferase [Anaerovibrio sp.]|uniref:TlyA family RNA methyltransferase n=1 Tax=Anaerovibrio sp. TaxID=1872532 RepID=UPI00261ADD0A|nr:TlyA family RNA methyltransferase [Anaerovibrio sp.]MDD6597972.1 TlyA family RNA methyltransferase [Anaerovibrio sp.]MDD7677618.1 TlyA family RNA methyltransferase [Anaerovibrio sp.]MDY2603394.1 TlyA family RNA methyltransferase [Anaerovibrio sp.]MDY4883701.1 TlyA family RNA methyltransferase [Anaerovibrio sp.]
MAKERLDALLVKRNLVQSRERAKTTIMAGLVLVDGQKVDKAGTMVKPEAEIRVLGNTLPYVSRGGLKLEKAIREFGVSLRGKVAADIGASTGGFTDCMLQNGAVKVFAIDVGYGQLAWSLRTDERVVNMERTNVRNVTPDQLGQPVDLASIDVAFISLEKVLPSVREMLQPEGEIVALIKPQFEAGREKVGKKGVVREPSVHEEVIFRVLALARQMELTPKALTYSPVKGPEGNIEYLVWLAKGASAADGVTDELVVSVVSQAHGALDK